MTMLLMRCPRFHYKVRPSVSIGCQCLKFSCRIFFEWIYFHYPRLFVSTKPHIIPQSLIILLINLFLVCHLIYHPMMLMRCYFIKKIVNWRLIYEVCVKPVVQFKEGKYDVTDMHYHVSYEWKYSSLTAVTDRIK